MVSNNSASVIQSNQYYHPFGMAFAEGTPEAHGEQDFKYNGKELDRTHGLNQYDYSARYYDPAYARFTTVDPLSEKYYSESPYVYVANNPRKYTDPDGREKLNGMGTRQKGDQVVNARKYIDNGMIHIYGHGSPDGMAYTDASGSSTRIKNASELQKFLGENSKTWQTRGEGENMFIILHSCKTGSSEYILPLAEFISVDMPNVVIGAPSSSLEVTIKGERVVNTKTGKIGTWDFYRNGEKIGSRSGDTNGNPDMIKYDRPQLIPSQNTQQNNTQQEKSYIDQVVDYFKNLF